MSKLCFPNLSWTETTHQDIKQHGISILLIKQSIMNSQIANDSQL